MIITFTPNQLISENTTKLEKSITLPEFSEPSENTLNAILNYSKNLEIKSSVLIEEFEVLKS
ncbi:MAG: hypothetical protein SFY56_09215 [Bacteroidota bacterium]|nr:hypothetical protein [Bacteroidota bacterium]